QAVCCGGTEQEGGDRSTEEGPEKRRILAAPCKSTATEQDSLPEKLAMHEKNMEEFDAFVESLQRENFSTLEGDPESVAGEYGRHSLYKMLGYFSLVGLLRLHSLLGDYYQAIKVLENIELNKKSMYSRVPECQVTTYYYVGFAYLMMRRYQDAIRVFANILLYIQRTKSMFQRTTYKYEMINKQNEQMHGLLAIALTMYPMRIDESIHTQLREKYGDKMLRMQKG
ncbi:hypothetical protein AB205_0157010, partial [Aquarana catesbeiana]